MSAAVPPARRERAVSKTKDRRPEPAAERLERLFASIALAKAALGRR